MVYIQIDIKTTPECYENFIAWMSIYPFESFVEGENLLTTYIEEKEWNLETNEVLKNLCHQHKASYQTQKLDNKNWNEEWEKNFTPVLVDEKCYIRAEFHEPNPDMQVEVVITPKMSFGTGHHATTYLMSAQLFDMDLKGKKVLDMGCGTGILAILAKKLGSGFTCGIDIDDWAVNNAKENCENNNHPEIEIEKGDAYTLYNKEKFDIILANINRNILLQDMKIYADVLTNGGYILFSGFYMEDEAVINAEAQKNNLKLIDRKNRENWSMLQYQKTK